MFSESVSEQIAGKVINMVRNNAQLQADTALKEAVNLGFHTHETDNCCNDVVADESQMLDLLKYCKCTVISAHEAEKY